MMDHIVTLALMSLVQALIKPIQDFINWLVNILITMPVKCSSDNVVELEVIQQYSDINGWSNVYSGYANSEVMDSILRRMYKSNINAKNYTIRFGTAKDNRDIYLLPKDIVIIDSINIQYEFTEETSNNMIKNIHKIRLSSALPKEHIINFIKDCRQEHNDIILEKDRIYAFYQMEDKKLCYSRYLLNNTICFEKIFFPEKKILLSSIERYRTGKIPKLNILLHGTPGCGKTSIIKAIANELHKHIVIIKLSHMTSDTMLMDALHGTSVLYDLGRASQSLTMNEKIYVFEDIDAELQKVLRPRSEAKVECIESKTKEQPRTSLTLSGILNALDGVTELNSIVIATTNHPENLDPAFTRYGRFNMKIHLGLITSENATSMVRYYYPEFKGIIEGAFITPAALGSYINTSGSLEELLSIISRHHSGDI